jgi:DNA-binding MarR family transcriptional regulator
MQGTCLFCQAWESAVIEAKRRSNVIAAFGRTARQMVAELVDRLDAAGFHGVSPATHTVFENIDRNGTGLSELAARADMTRQSMRELVAVLEKRGWVRRDQDPTDLRAQIVRLTPEGRRLARAALQAMTKIESEWQARWQRAGCPADLGSAIESARACSTVPQKRVAERPAAKAEPQTRRIARPNSGG